MKKLLLLFFILFIFPCAKAEVAFDCIGNVIYSDTGVEQQLLVKSNGNNNYDIAIRPLDDFLTDSEGKHKIPLDSIFINNGTEDIFLKYNSLSYLYTALKGGKSRVLTAKIRDFGIVPKGNYNLNLEILQLNSDTQNTIHSSSFILQFIVPSYQKLSFYERNPQIKVGIDNALQKNKQFNSEKYQQVYITSNSDWVLSVKTGDLLINNDSNYFIRATGASNNVKDYIKERYRLEPNREIIIAKGNANSHNEYVSIEYSVENSDNHFLKPGEYVDNIKFVLREDR